MEQKTVLEVFTEISQILDQARADLDRLAAQFGFVTVKTPRTQVMPGFTPSDPIL